MGYETLIRRAHVMTRKNTLKSLPTDTEFRVVGLDLAKSDVSVAAIPIDDNTPSLVDRMTFSTGQEKFRRLCSRWSHATATACCAFSLKISATKSKSSAAGLFQCGSTPICQDRRPTSMMRSR